MVAIVKTKYGLRYGEKWLSSTCLELELIGLADGLKVESEGQADS